MALLSIGAVARATFLGETSAGPWGCGRQGVEINRARFGVGAPREDVSKVVKSLSYRVGQTWGSLSWATYNCVIMTKSLNLSMLWFSHLSGEEAIHTL